MAITYKNIIPSKQAESTQTVQYTATSVKCVIDKLTAVNTSASVETISVNLIPSGGSAGDENIIVIDKALSPNQNYSFPEVIGHVLESGGMISTIASAATSITIRASGREIVS